MQKEIKLKKKRKKFPLAFFSVFYSLPLTPATQATGTPGSVLQSLPSERQQHVRSAVHVCTLLVEKIVFVLLFKPNDNIRVTLVI